MHVEIRSGYFVAFRGSGYGSYDSKTEARHKAVELVSRDRDGSSARIYEGIALITNYKLHKGSELNVIDVVTLGDCAALDKTLFH